METRLVVFLTCLAGFAALFTLNGYKKYFKPNNKVALEYIDPAKIAEMKQPKKVEVVVKEGPAPAELGKIIYTEKGQCIKCHGANGEGNPAEEAPVLQGQHDWYIVSTLKKFQEKKERRNPKMEPYIKDLTVEDFKNVAAYIKTL